ncbi:MAG: cell division protein ZapE [Dermabacter sp.]|nr:cell division protein ZapE [Dermabacter sp.]
MPSSLTSRFPQPTPASLVEALVPPPRFSTVSLENYTPNPEYPSQAAALESVRRFADGLGRQGGSGVLGRLLRRSSAPRAGLYLDGGFGVGKTHLLTSLYRLAPGRALYGTFVEYTNLVGVLGYQQAVDEFRGAQLLCIDEFELDDVGDTLLMSRFIRELSDRGVAIAATSNTLPRALGEGRFAAQDFLREISAMADRFEVVRIDGDDYRHRDTFTEAPRFSADDVAFQAERSGEGAVMDPFDDVLAHLVRVHPSRYGVLVEGIDHLYLTGVRQVSDHHQGLRLVVLIDRLYDRKVPLTFSGVGVGELFSPELLASGYAKKYLRCLSRFGALAADGARAAA